MLRAVCVPLSVHQFRSSVYREKGDPARGDHLSSQFYSGVCRFLRTERCDLAAALFPVGGIGDLYDKG